MEKARGRPKGSKNIKPSGQIQTQKEPSTNGKGSRPTNPEMTRILMEYKERRNQFTLALFSRIESLGDSLVSKAVDLAMSGNEKMLTFMLERCINNNFINRLERPLLSKTVEEIDSSQQFVIEKMGEGTLDVNHGMNLVKTLSLKRDTINVRRLEEQVERIMEDE
jgi:hypothetical protein